MCAAAHPQRHPDALAIRRHGRCRRALRRRLRPCDDARQSADPRDRAGRRVSDRRGGAGSRPHARAARAPTISATSPGSATAGIDRAGTVRHAPAGARMALSHPQRSLALRPAAQVQRRLRRRRPYSRRWRRPTTSASRRCGSREGMESSRASGSALLLGGITGHRGISRATSGVVCRPEECCAVADAIVRVFIAHGDRTDRTKARLKYVLDAWGFDEISRGGRGKARRAADARRAKTRLRRARRSTARRISACTRSDSTGSNWIGVALPVGKTDGAQMRGLAAIARDFGDGDIRLTVWQNLLISGVADDQVDAAKAAIEALGLDWQATSLRAGLVACTGATGCKFAAAHTKEHAVEIADHVDARLSLDPPVNIHLTGCHHSCAQHYIGDIGLMGAKVAINDEGDQVEGYTIVVGGGFAEQAKIGRELWRDVRADECAGKVEGLLRAYLDHREDPAESFQAFAARHEPDELKALVGARRRHEHAASAAAARRSFPRARRSRPSSRRGSTASSRPCSRRLRTAPRSKRDAAHRPAAEPAVVLADNDSAPWHDPEPADRRALTMAAGKPLAPRLMAAMAQQDCGQCGYNCADYANAIVPQEGRAADALRAGRQGNRAHAQGARAGNRPGATVAAPALAKARSKTTPAPADRAGRSRDNPAEATFPVAPPAQWRGLGQDHLACRVRPFAPAASTMSSATVSACFPRIRRRSPTRSSRCSARARKGRSRGKTLRDVLIEDVSLGVAARRPVPTSLLCLRRRAARARRARWRTARIPTATRRRSTCWRRCTNSPACGRARKPSSKRSIRCSRGSIRSPPRSRPIRGAISLTVDGVRYRIGPRERLGVASTFLGERAVAGRDAQGLCAEGAWLSSARRSRRRRSSWSGRAPASRRSAPSCRSARAVARARPQLAVLRPSAARA